VVRFSDANFVFSRSNNMPEPDLALKRALFRGIAANQITVTDSGVQLAAGAPVEVIQAVAPAFRVPFVLRPGMRHSDFGEAMYLEEDLTPTVKELARQIAAANAAIDAKYAQVAGLLGSPVATIEYGANDGYYRKYERGAIYLSRRGEAHEVHGAIYQKFLSLRAETGFLGYPQTDEQSTTLGTGQFNHFEGGSIYWTAATGACEIHGPIRDTWWQLEGDRSHLGYPISDVETPPRSSGAISHFQYGSIILTADSNIQVDSHSVFRKSALSNSSVTCNVELWMNSAGDWHHTGHMHNSGFVGFSVNVASTPLFQDAAGNVFARTAAKHLGGTTAAGSRDYDWKDFGSQEPFIRDNWAFLRNAPMKTVLEVDFTFGDFIQLVGSSFPVAVAALIAGTVMAGGKVCGPRGSIYRDPVTGDERREVVFDVKPPGEPCP
jgi:LGFP repeat-containing protein